MTAHFPEPSGNGTGNVNGKVLSDKDFRRVADLIMTIAGISLPIAKKSLVQTRLARRLRALRLGSFEEYCDLICGDQADAQDEIQHLISAITTNVTQFFREPHHFDDLKSRTLPPLLEKVRAGGRLRIWSAGCSTGEEPYSLAMTLMEMEPNIARFDAKILATDLDLSVLQTASEATYAERLVSGIPSPLLGKYFSENKNAAGKSYTAQNSIRSLITFKRLNLTQKFPMPGPFDVIFCRNVVIYFDEPTELKVWKSFSEVLNKGGRLHVGHSERVNTNALSMFESDGVTTYTKL